MYDKTLHAAIVFSPMYPELIVSLIQENVMIFLAYNWKIKFLRFTTTKVGQWELNIQDRKTFFGERVKSTSRVSICL